MFFKKFPGWSGKKMFKPAIGITSSSQWPRGRQNHNHNHNYNYGKGKTWINFWQNPLCWLASLKHHIHKSWSSSWVGVVGEVTSSCWKPQQVSEEQRKGDSDMVTQQIPTSHIPTRWEYDIMIRGGNMTQSHSHHIWIFIYIDRSGINIDDDNDDFGSTAPHS